MQKQKQQSKQNVFNITRIYITIYYTYPLLYCNEHIQMTSNDSTINVETKKQNEQNDKIEFITIRTLTDYYIVQDIHLNDKK